MSDAKRKAQLKNGKLVRDKIRNFVDTGDFLTLDPTELFDALRTKLNEEANEVASATTVIDITEELADLLEVITALVAHMGIEDDVYIAMLEKRNQRGGFNDGLFKLW